MPSAAPSAHSAVHSPHIHASHSVWHSIAWGTVPEWVLIVTNALLIIAAFVTLHRDRVRIRALEASQVIRAADAAREKVAGVCAWPEDWSAGDVHAVCRNATDEPIYEVFVRAAAEPAATAPVGQDAVTKRVALIGPGEALDAHLELPVDTGRAPHVDVRFTDPRGTTWWRRSNGVLEPIGD